MHGGDVVRDADQGFGRSASRLDRCRSIDVGASPLDGLGAEGFAAPASSHGSGGYQRDFHVDQSLHKSLRAIAFIFDLASAFA
jgi:hypothetical protein